jgi:hypothetical protein
VTAALALGVLVLAMSAGMVVLDSLISAAGTGGPTIEALYVAAALVPATTVSIVLAIRRPGNPIGWLLFAILFVGVSPGAQYDVWVFRLHHGSQLLGRAALVLQESWPLFLVAIAVLVWVFPDGKLPGGRWRRPSVVLLVVGLVLGVAATSSGVVDATRPVVRVTADGESASSSPAGYVIIFLAVIVLSVAAWLAWLVIQIPTYRHAGGERRQQLKWLYSGAAVSVVAFIFGVFVIPLATHQTVGFGTNPVIRILLTLAFGTLPVCLGVAVLKYRLYELDRIISRVVAYTLITALLAAVFFGLVLLATHVLPFHDSVPVAVSTLITAALFNPLRRRVQHAVDRRFNRSRYDAEAVVAAFAARLRQSVELDVIERDLVGVVNDSVQPTQVAVWLAPGPS